MDKSHGFWRVRWVARIISLLPGAGMILGYLGWDLHLFLRKGLFSLRVIGYQLIPGAIFLAIGGVAWRWPRVGGVLQIAFGIFLFSLFIIGKADWAPEVLLPIASAFLIGGILHLIVSPWGRKLQ